MINKEYMSKPESSHDQAIRQGEQNMEQRQGKPVCMVIHRTFTISEKITIADYDDRLENEMAACDLSELLPGNILRALKQLFPLSNFSIEYDGQDIDQLSAKEAGI